MRIDTNHVNTAHMHGLVDRLSECSVCAGGKRCPTPVACGRAEPGEEYEGPSSYWTRFWLWAAGVRPDWFYLGYAAFVCALLAAWWLA